jgi:cellulose synthase/poly-beta-1,6-N-acetylglucosamine synthase-like glycosyltransferase
MSSIGALVAWTGFGLVCYVYVGYPAMLYIISKVYQRPVRQEECTPSVTLVISAFNEADVIRGKLENSLALDYPRDRLEILVVSDASTDQTDRIVESFQSRGVQLLRMPVRGGKTVGLNAACHIAKGDIILFSDANILYQRDTVRRLVTNFADPSVGCVTGDSRYVEEMDSAAHTQENAYWGYERMIRTMESQIGSTVGGDGAIFAIRRELFRPLPPEAINDLVIPLQIVADGYRAVFEPTAIGFEPSAGDFRKEFRRKRRIVNRSWRGVMSVGTVLNPLRVGVFAWQVWSHKVLRWLMLPLVVASAAGCVMALESGWFYQVGIAGFVGSLVLAAAAVVLPERGGWLSRVAQGLFYFYLVNFAALLGVVKALSGHVEMVWAPERN